MGWFWNKSKSKQRRNHGKFGHRTLSIDGLERREMMTANPVLNGASIVVDATHEAHGVQVTFTQSDNGTKDYLYDDKITTSVKYANGQTTNSTLNLYRHDSNGNPTHIKQVEYLYFYGSEKGDVVRNNTNVRSIMWGGKGNDAMYGGSNEDQLLGSFGSDSLYGNGSADFLLAHEGGGHDPNAVDHLFGGAGVDLLWGNYGGVNYLHGGQDNDRIEGGDKAINFMYGDGGTDWLFGGDKGAVNHLFGGAGNDYMLGGSGELMGPKVVNHMIDDEGADQFFGGNRALNYMFAGDGSSYASQKDLIVGGEFGSYDYIDADDNDTIWNPLFGPYLNKPK